MHTHIQKMKRDFMDLVELGNLLDLLRQKGVVEFEFNEVKVRLGPANEAEGPKMERVNELKAEFQKSIIGRDGLTKEQQEELYGQQVDAFEG